MNGQRVSRAVAALVVALAFPLVGSAQEIGGHHHFDGGRGDVHSKGWDELMKVKGPPVAPSFPQVGAGITRHQLDNGLIVYLAEDRQLPLVQVQLTFRGGEFFESDEEWGAADLCGSQMLAGGTESMTPDELEDRLALLAATLSTRVGDETGSASLDVLSAHLDEGLSLLADVLLRPRFDPERLALAKRRQVFRLMHQNDDPGSILRREFARLLYGEDHPRGRQMTPERVRAITREDLLAAHARFVRPGQSVLVAHGDFESAAMLESIRRRFGGWERGETLPRDLPRATAQAKPGVYLVDRPVNQSNIAIGHLGTDRDDPRRFAVELMNDILGGGSFSSRITERVRSDEGLAYSARSRYDTSDRDLGTFAATVQTKTSTTAQAIDSILDEIRKMAKGGSLSRNEFETSHEARLYSFPARFEDPFDNAVRLARYELEGRPADTDRREYEGTLAVTPDAAEQAARDYLKPGALTIMVVGDASEIGEELKAFGPVTLVPLQEFEAPRRGRRMRQGAGT